MLYFSSRRYCCYLPAILLSTTQRNVSSSTAITAFFRRSSSSTLLSRSKQLAFLHNNTNKQTSEFVRNRKTKHSSFTTTHMSAQNVGGEGNGGESSNNTSKTKRFALLQFKVSSNKIQNHETVTAYLQKAAAQNADVAILPEIWNGPYATAAFPEYAEIIPSVGYELDSSSHNNNLSSPSSIQLLIEAAQKHQMHIIGGSISEKLSDGDDDDKIYNTCVVVNPQGKIVAKHRKMHLFDVDVPNGIRFKESDTLSPGNDVSWFDLDDDWRVGVGICYDIRFPEYAQLLCQKHQCNILVYPGAFNLTTGPAHWELLQRARAVDNQCYVVTASPARTYPEKDSAGGESKYPHYTAWGHSTAVSPWGEVVGTCDEEENLVVVDLDLKKVREMRSGIPVESQRRLDLYDLVKEK